MLLKLAWRNIWRNKRRTIITMLAIFFAVFLSCVMRSFQEGTYTLMIRNVVGFYSGDIQIHGQDYWENKSLDYSLTWSDSLEKELINLPHTKGYVCRLESFVLAASDSNTKGVMVVGTNPIQEKNITQYDEKLIEGKILQTGDQSILIAQGVAKYLKLGVGDTMVMIGQGYHGSNAVGKYHIKGILKFPSPDLNNRFVYMNLQNAQTLFDAPNQLTSIAILLNDNQELSAVDAQLKKALATYEVMTWKEMMPELVQMIEADKGGNVITIGILYMIVGFGIFGTLIMMLQERQHEFGVLIAIGMRKTQLAIIVFIESIILGLLAAIIGTLFSYPLALFFRLNPIRLEGEAAMAYEKMGFEPVMMSLERWDIFIEQALIVLIVTMILSLYPIIKILRIRAINAMRA